MKKIIIAVLFMQMFVVHSVYANDSCTDYPNVTVQNWFNVDMNGSFNLSTYDLVMVQKMINAGWNYIAPNDIGDLNITISVLRSAILGYCG